MSRTKMAAIPVRRVRKLFDEGVRRKGTDRG